MKEYTAKEFDIPEIQGISKEAIDVHLGLYKGYVKNVNDHYTALKKACADGKPDPLVLSAITRRISFELSGVENHELYFASLVGGAKECPEGSSLHAKMTEYFGGKTGFLAGVKMTAMSMRGIGWVVVVYDKEKDAFHMLWISDHELGNVNLPAVLIVDMWEHAYMTDYKPSEKEQYVDAYLNAINWEFLAERFDTLC